MTSASAFASGLGCFSLRVNGRKVTKFLEPGWAVLPTVRVHYRAFDLTDILAPGGGSNTLDVRLGMCKFGYVDGFCIGAHAATATCKAFRLQLNIRYSDGSTQSVYTRTGDNAWMATTTNNPIRYAHLYHGTVVDGRLDTHSHTQTHLPLPPGYSPAKPASFVMEAGRPPVNASRALGDMTLHVMPPMDVTEKRAPISVERSLGDGRREAGWDFPRSIHI